MLGYGAAQQLWQPVKGGYAKPWRSDLNQLSPWLHGSLPVESSRRGLPRGISTDGSRTVRRCRPPQRILRYSRSCWLPEHELTARRDHLADRAPANNEEHCEACRHQDQLKGQRRHRPMNVSGLGEDCERSKNSDMILKRNLVFAAC